MEYGFLNIKDELEFHKTRLTELDEELEKEFNKFLDMYLKDVSKINLDHFQCTLTYPMLEDTYKGKHWWEYTNVPKELIDYRMSVANHVECIENLMSHDAQEKLGDICEEKAIEEFIKQFKEQFDNSYSIKFEIDVVPLEDVYKK